MMKLLEIIDLAVDSKSNTVNCEFLRVVLNEIVLRLNLTDHSIELKNDDETVEYCDVAVIDEKIEHEKVSTNNTSISSRKSVESRFSNFDSSPKLQQSPRRRLSEKILCAETSSPPLSSSSNAFVFDFINIEKRLDALEIGIRSIADAFEKVQFNFNKDQVNLMANKQQLDPDILSSLNDRIDWLSDKMRKFNCEECNNSDDDNNSISSSKIKTEMGEDEGKIDDDTTRTTTKRNEKRNNVDELLLSLQSNVNDIRKSLRDYQDEENQFMKSVSKQLETFRSDLINCLKEIQDMMDCKLDKCFVPELRQLMDEKLNFVDEKIGEKTRAAVESYQRTAAGTTKALIRYVNCVSCGDNVVQSDTLHLPQNNTNCRRFRN